MELILDIGNNFTKSAIMSKKGVVQKSLDAKGSYENLLDLCSGVELTASIVSSVRPIPTELMDFLATIPKVVTLSHETPLPIQLDYDTPGTLGRDRIAAVVGANALFPKHNSLVIDAGTCITYDFIDANAVYHGGSISPGLQMRYRALNNFTGALPWVEHQDPKTLVGKSTEQSIRTGVYNGMINEINGTIGRYKLEKSPLNLVICGGDAEELKKGIEEEAIHEDNLVLIGLHNILIYNALHKNF